MKFRNMPILSLLLFFVLSAQQAVADTVLVVQKTDGTRETFLLSDSPVVTMEGSCCDFSTSNVSLRLQRDNIAEMHFEDAADGISAVRHGDVHFNLLGNHTVEIVGMRTAPIAVYDMGGKAVRADIKASGDTLTVSLNGLPLGTYIIKYGNDSIKISNK